MAEEINTLAEQLRGMILKRGKRAALAASWIKIAFIPAFAAMAGVSQFADFKNGNASTIQVIGIIGTMLVGVLSFIVGIFDKDGADELAKAAEALDLARDMNRDIEIFELYNTDLDQTVEYIQAVSLARSVIERLLVTPSGDVDTWVRALLDACARNIVVALAFEMGHRWTVTIYRAVDTGAQTTQLLAVATTRALPCDLAHARPWEVGTGIVGASYSNRSEVVIPDLSSPGVRELFGTKANVTKADDLDVYKSMAASPIRLDGRDEPWGVIVATNDQIDHFDTDDEAAMRPDMVVKEIAGWVALLASAYARVEAAAATNPAPSPSMAVGTGSDAGRFTTWVQAKFTSRRTGS